MELSERGLALLKVSEGFRSQVYKDINGFPTIGYGHKLLPIESFPDGVSEEQAAALLKSDIYSAQTAVARLVKVPLTQGQYDALVDFVFNLGPGRLAVSTLLKMLNAGKYDGASLHLLEWDHANHIEVAALKARRTAEFNLWHGKD